MMPRAFASIVVLLVLAAGQSQTGEQGYVPKGGFVPDEKTAIKIAEAVLIPIYGQEKVESEHPLHAMLKDDVWTVETSAGRVLYGGGAVVKVSKADARILFMIHYK